MLNKTTLVFSLNTLIFNIIPIQVTQINQYKPPFNAIRHIFLDFNNPGKYYRPADQKQNVRYSYSGTWATPSWAQVDYFFDGAYVYFFTLLYEKKAYGFLEKTLHQFLKQYGEIIAQEAMHQVNDFFFNYLHLPKSWGLETFEHHAKMGSVVGFLKNFKEVFDSNNKINNILGSSINSYIINSTRDLNAEWLYYEPTEGYNVAYDGGFNYFLKAFKFKNYQKNLQTLYNLFKVSWDPNEIDFIDQKQSFLQYYSARNFRSERRSGASNYLSYWDKHQKGWKYFEVN